MAVKPYVGLAEWLAGPLQKKKNQQVGESELWSLAAVSGSTNALDDGLLAAYLMA